MPYVRFSPGVLSRETSVVHPERMYADISRVAVHMIRDGMNSDEIGVVGGVGPQGPRFVKWQQTGLPRGLHQQAGEHGFTFYYLIDREGRYRFGIDMPEFLADRGWTSDLHQFLDMLDPLEPPQLGLVK